MAKDKFKSTNRLKSFSYTIKGLRFLFSNEYNARIHLIAAFFVIALGLYFTISSLEWIAILFCIAIVFCMETLNTAIEQLCNKVEREKDPIIGRVKDLAAGAVLVSALFAALIGLIIFIPKIMLLV